MKKDKCLNYSIIMMIILGIIGVILLSVLISKAEDAIIKNQCDNMSITDAWRHEECKEYFIKEAKKSDEK